MAFRVVGGVTAGTVLVVGSKPMTEVIFELLHGKLSFIAVVTKCAGTEGDLLAAQAHNMGGGAATVTLPLVAVSARQIWQSHAQRASLMICFISCGILCHLLGIGNAPSETTKHFWQSFL